MDRITLGDIPSKNPLIVILGPTASGKTDLSLSIYEQIDCEIISADSRQVYKYLDIGTAKPSREILSNYKHHLIDFLEPNQDFSAGQFSKLSREIIFRIYEQNKIPLVVGGTGLYIDVLCNGMVELSPNVQDKSIRDNLNKDLETKGKEYLYNLLQQVDRDSAEKYSDKNPRRIIRALEFFYNTGVRFSEAQRELTKQNNFSVYYFGIDFERQELYSRINQRCLNMWQVGIIDETQEILKRGYSPNLNSMNTVGYKEAIKFLNNEMTNQEALNEMMKNTRHYAKRQLTWFRKNEKIQWIIPKLVNKFIIYDFIINRK